MGGFEPDGEMQMNARVALIECSICSALLEIHPQEITGEPGFGWSARDEDLCKAPPLKRCPHAHAETKRRFPDFDI